MSWLRFFNTFDQVPGGEEHEDHVIGEEGNGLGTTVEEEATRSGRESKKGKSKRDRKQKTTSEEEPNKSSETPQKKKFKHSSRRKRNRTCKLAEPNSLQLKL